MTDAAAKLSAVERGGLEAIVAAHRLDFWEAAVLRSALARLDALERVAEAAAPFAGERILRGSYWATAQSSLRRALLAAGYLDATPTPRPAPERTE